MQEVNGSTIALPGSRESLHEILRQGAQQMLAQAIEAEVAEWIEQHAHLTDERGRRQVVRNGHLPERKVVTGVGEVAVEQPVKANAFTRSCCRRICGRPRASRN